MRLNGEADYVKMRVALELRFLQRSVNEFLADSAVLRPEHKRHGPWFLAAFVALAASTLVVGPSTHRSS